MFVFYCVYMNNNTQLCISYAFKLQYARFMKFLSFCNVSFLFSACFHAFHKNLSFSVLDSNSHNNEMSVAKPRFSVWNSIETIGRSPVDRQEWPARTFLFSTDTGCSVFSFLLCSIYHDWRMLTACSYIYYHKLNADARRKCEKESFRSARF